MKVSQISGVDSFSLFNYNGKLYAMFGDIHYQVNKNCDKNYHCDYFNYTFDKVKTYHSSCTSILPLLYLWFLYNNAHAIKTDVYIEASFTKLDSYDIQEFEHLIETRKMVNAESFTTIPPNNHTSWLQLAVLLFASCLTTDKTKCLFYPNVHMHYADIRFFNQLQNTPFDIAFLTNYTKKLYLEDVSKDILLIIDTLFSHYEFILEGIIGTKFDAMVEFLLSIPIQNIAMKRDYHKLINKLNRGAVVREGKKMHRVAAELLKLKHLNYPIYEKLIKYINNFEFDVSDYKKFLNLKNLENYILIMAHQFVVFESFTVDIYTLSRMFTQLDSSQIITYTGLYHHIYFSDFFKNYLHVQPLFEQFNVDLKTLKSTNQCISFNQLEEYINVNQFRNYYFKIK